MDSLLGGLFVLALLVFAGFAAIESCAIQEPMFYEPMQQAAVENGTGEYYVDEYGKTRFRMLRNR